MAATDLYFIESLGKLTYIQHKIAMLFSRVRNLKHYILLYITERIRNVCWSNNNMSRTLDFVSLYPKAIKGKLVNVNF